MMHPSRERLTSRDNFYEWQYLRSRQIKRRIEAHGVNIRSERAKIFATTLIRIYGMTLIDRERRSRKY